ncbi:hypothetical protein [Sphingobacterium sp. DR205]|uniref:hypothetical protein n=1 Tax=Sphingobacterium sp. DR205 TaxID=2713573 RepID=UPI0013E439B4|nr:hypothetical protein [Sphingobacterium sp. DR205]QIH34013.1 hypothetical protein G6053_14475 [Sphingobacterium sp. DR205]
MKEYTFKYQNNSGLLYLILVLIGIPLGIILPTVWLMNYVQWIFWPNIVLMLCLMGFGVWRFVKKSRATDTISLDENGFTSHSYGRVLYQDIHSIPPYGLLQAPPPSMRIKLNNGKKLVWLFNPDHPKSAADIIIFTAFREELLRHLGQQAVVLQNEHLKENIATSGVAVGSKQKNNAKALVSQLEESKKRDYKYIAIPISAVFALVMLIRTCGADFIQQQRDKEMAGFRDGILSIETDYENNVQKAKNVAAEYGLTFGPIFLWTNDPRATVVFSPDIPQDPYGAEIDVIGLRHVEDNKLLEQYIQHPDSVNYDLTVVNPAEKFYAVMNKSIFSRDDSLAIPIYLTVYNPKESLPTPFGQQAVDSTFRPIRYSTSIAMPRAGEPKSEILDNMDFASVRSILQKYKGTYFYMVAKEQDGLSAQQFEKIKMLVLTNFGKHGVDTGRFESRRYNSK